MVHLVATPITTMTMTTTTTTTITKMEKRQQLITTQGLSSDGNADILIVINIKGKKGGQMFGLHQVGPGSELT